MKNSLEICNVTHAYHTVDCETKVLENISFSVNEGEFVAIIGPSGCGKSTLLSIIAGLIASDYGEIKINSNKMVSKFKFGYMFQKDNLLEWKTIYKNIILGLEINHICTKDNLEFVDNMINKYGLSDFIGKHPSELSGGMRQRAALIRTLSLKPEIILLDEPFSALDYQNKLRVSKDISDIIRENKKTIILVTHDIAEAISICDRIIVLSKRPSTIKAICKVNLDRNKNILELRQDKEFMELQAYLWGELND